MPSLKTNKMMLEVFDSGHHPFLNEVNPLSANFTKCSTTLKQLCHFVGLALKELKLK